jgi:hypothetical protein
VRAPLPALALALATGACAGSPAAQGPAGLAGDAALDASGDWGDADADEVAAAMSADCLAAPWIGEWRLAHGKKPVVRLHPIRNRTDAYVDLRYFTKQLEAALVRSGRVDVVSSVEEAEINREERADQALHAADETAKSQGEELGSDFVLSGWVLASDDRAGGEAARTYLTSVEVTETRTNRKVWLGQKRLRKLAAAPR